MSSKFSNDLANNMSSILKDSNFQRIFSKTASTIASEALDETSDDSLESAFNAFASKKKKDDEDEKSDEKDDEKSSDKKSDKKSKKDEKDEDKDEGKEKDEKKSDKKSKKDEDKDDEDEKDDKKKDKKKSFPFFKKKKAGKCSCDKDCACKKGEKCPCEGDCGECMSCGDQMYANALKHIVESFTTTSDVLDNMGLEKSAVATMAILNHIIEEAANVKLAKESEEHKLKAKIEDLKEKFKKMHAKDAVTYDADAAEELDNKITKLEEELKDLKKKDLSKSDENDVRGTDLLLGLEDPEALESFSDPELEDPKSSAVLEDILSKNPKLVDEVVPGLKAKQLYNLTEEDIENQLKQRIQSRLPEINHTTSNGDTDIDALLNQYQNSLNNTAKLPGQHLKDMQDAYKNNPPVNSQVDSNLKTKIDELNADDIAIACTLIDGWVKNADEFDDDLNDKVNTEDVKSIIDILGNYSQDELNQREKSFKHPKDLNAYSKDFFDQAMGDKNNTDVELENDGDFGLDKLEEEYPEAYAALPEPYRNDSVLTFFIDPNGNLCAEADLGLSKEEFVWLTDTGEWVGIE